ncbi:hypothetical protein O181_053524 [Austropuccinia psidii MF-1]|uniref:Uncharacterized protein n=1 Tax=Austropuccinia psidii MF-1 TaxID=1389203 RepID=A0A9Q3E2S8_9BASI|nr:hypothetical protein [Austropuccinia psidii MF-1]
MNQSFDHESITEDTFQTVPPVDDQQINRNDRAPRLKFICPCHPTLIAGDVDPLHILPYARRPRAYMTESEETQSTYNGALKLDNKSEWI